MNETCTYLFNSHIVSSFGKFITEMYFNSVDQETFVTGQFAREVMYEREHVSFMTRDELNAILRYLCTEWTVISLMVHVFDCICCLFVCNCSVL